MRITLVGPTDLPELLPLVRAYCDFYEVTPSDPELLDLADPGRRPRRGSESWARKRIRRPDDG